MANTNSTDGYTEAFYDAYTRGYEAILQEKKFFWDGTMRMEALQGENQSYDFVGSIELTERTNYFKAQFFIAPDCICIVRFYIKANIVYFI